MPDFSKTHITETRQNIAHVVEVRPNATYKSQDFECVIYQGQFWDVNGNSVIDNPPQEVIDFVNHQTDEWKAAFGFDQPQQAEPEPEEEDDKLLQLVRNHWEDDEAYDSKGRLSLEFFAEQIGRRVFRKELDAAAAIVEAENEDPDEE